jgi:uncharacterized membrane-anchored protein
VAPAQDARPTSQGFVRHLDGFLDEIRRTSQRGRSTSVDGKGGFGLRSKIGKILSLQGESSHCREHRHDEGRHTLGMSDGLAVSRRVLRVPQITVYFWVIKGLSTALGESTSDYLVHAIDPVVAVLLGFTGFVVALAIQFSMRRYVAWSYWLAVAMVGIFGTMAADVLHVRFGVPYAVSTVLYGIALAAVFVTWDRFEHTLDVHTIDTPRREAFYWAAVVTTFAMGTAVGDLTAVTFNLGYLGSLVLFAILITVPAIGYYRFKLNPIVAFWTAYVLTRPLGASFADWLGKPEHAGGLGIGSGPVTVALAILIALLVGYLAVTGADVQRT